MYDVICIGTALVDSIIRGFDPCPVSASGYRAASNSLSAGGEAVNASAAAAKLGLKAAILCSLGQDAAGDIVRRELNRCGVSTDRIVPSASTPVTTIFVREDGTRQSITNEAHRFNFHPERDPSMFTDAKALVLGSLFRAPFDEPEIIRSVAARAKDAGQIVFADTKLPNFRRLTAEDIRDSLSMTDYITPNEDEARYFTGQHTPEKMADVFLELGVRNVIIKLGGEGCYLKNRTESIFSPAWEVRAADTTGAGDNFLAGFVSEILRGADHESALRFANACGAVCTTEAGASAALKSREQVLAWMKLHRQR